MFTSTLLRMVFAGLVSCSAASSLRDKSSYAYTPATDLSRLAAVMPQSSLPAPVGQLKYVVLGVGTQNYTCTGGNGVVAPGTTGAVATLYDIGSTLNNDPASWRKISTLSALALSLGPHSAAFDSYMKWQGYNHIVGHHYFSLLIQTASPVFALDQLSQSPYPIAKVSKINSTDAPKSAYPGLKQEGAVPWLYLADRNGLSVGGIDTVYRIQTAGGKAPVTCKDEASFEVEYAAQYWMFGLKHVSNNDKNYYH